MNRAAAVALVTQIGALTDQDREILSDLLDAETLDVSVAHLADVKAEAKAACGFLERSKTVVGLKKVPSSGD